MEPDACKNLVDITCPLYDGEVATYRGALPWSANYPKVSQSYILSSIPKSKYDFKIPISTGLG